MAGDYEKRMLRVLEYIHAHPDGDLSLDALADVAAMSRFHWHRVFHAMTGETCAQAVRRMRLNRAAFWLRNTEMGIAEIAARVGYPSVQSFGRAFRAGYGLSPAQFRKKGADEALQLRQRERSAQMYDVTFETAPARHLVGLMHKGPYLEIGGTYEKLGAIATARNLWPDVKAMVAVYLSDPGVTPQNDLRSFAGLEMAGEGAPEGLEAHDIPGGKVARLRHVGPYTGLQDAYTYLFGEWLPESGREPGESPCYEVYVNNPGEVAQKDLITDIHLPLKS